VSVITDQISQRGASIDSGTPQQVPPLEMNQVINNQREVLNGLSELKTSLRDSLLKPAVAQPQQGLSSFETVQHFADIKEHIHVVKRNVEHLIQQKMNPGEKVHCPEPEIPACLSTVHFVVFIVIQSIIFFSYIMYRSQQEAAAKKFF